MLSEREFEVLVALEAKVRAGEGAEAGAPGAAATGAAAGAPELAGGAAPGTADVLAALAQAGYVEAGKITPAGVAALEPYRAKRAVFFAAGFGSRLLPITVNTPKPLVRVHGVRIIQRLIDAVRAAGIEEIYLVRGYLAAEFESLARENPDVRITFIDNPLYNSTNNISSAVAAAGHMRDAYVFESDLLLENPQLIQRYQYRSNYVGVPVAHTDDWCLTVRDGRAVHIAKGGDDCYHMFGISYWTEADGVRLADRMAKVFAREDGKQIFWDDVALNWYTDDFDVRVRPCTFEDVQEIDTFAELQEVDEAYRF